VSFFAGVRAFFGGIGFVVARPSVWPLAFVPVLAATLLLGGGAALAIWGATKLVTSVLLQVLLSIAGVIVAFLIAITLAQPLSGFALEAIARRQETALGGRVWPNQPFLRSTLRSLRVSLTALAVSLPILALLGLVTLLFPPAGVVTVPLKLIVAGLAAAYDFLDYPFSVRGVDVRERVAFMRANFSAVLGFGLSAAAVLLIPGMGLFLLPFGVAGATRMVVKECPS